MDIAEFIEQDILVYLDKYVDAPAAEKSTVQTRDYEKELLAAFDAHDIPRAKRILHDLKAVFDRTPNDEPQKKKLRELLKRLHTTFIAKVHKSLQVKKEKKDTGLHLLLLDEVKTQLALARKNVAEKKLGAAARNYQNARSAARELAKMPHALKEEFLSTYETIKGKDDEKDKDAHLLLQLEQEKYKLDTQLGNNDIKSAMRTYKEMRELVKNLRNEKLAEETAKKLVKIYQIIKEVQRHMTIAP